jgi:hypothetical protein
VGISCVRVWRRRSHDGIYASIRAVESCTADHFDISGQLDNYWRGHVGDGSRNGFPLEFVGDVEWRTARVNIREFNATSIHSIGERCGDHRFGADFSGQPRTGRRSGFSQLGLYSVSGTCDYLSKSGCSDCGWSGRHLDRQRSWVFAFLGGAV